MHQPAQQVGFTFVIAGGGYAARQGDAQRRGSALTHRAVHLQPVFPLEPYHRVIGLLAEYTVHRAAEISVLLQLLLNQRDLIALIPPGHHGRIGPYKGKKQGKRHQRRNQLQRQFHPIGSPPHSKNPPPQASLREEGFPMKKKTIRLLRASPAPYTGCNRWFPRRKDRR